MHMMHFFTAWLQGQNIQSSLGNQFEAFILNGASPSKTKVWLALAFAEDHVQHDPPQK